ncbi:DNA methyltransferase [Arthrobacter crystallopoietes]|uniref:DNA methylase n=1 Tax=Crystallibacter crystallopoietes TaxID=37928 RepID=A0A1H0XLC4_9MICC|nr:DNA methyltransferase [Arthrobacter crystallopoietes]SDQ03707.1 DNA methylase [Arthrobacter crystallopoietes]
MSLEVTEPYRSEITGAKGSIFYRAHSYHTKVPPEGIVPVIEHYTSPGDTVLDPFCGSGMTGVAALLSGRQGILSDLSPAAVHIATGYTAAHDGTAVAAAGQNLLGDLAELERELYGTTCTRCSGDARIEYTVWSDTISCPHCRQDILFWDSARQPDGTLSKDLECPLCSASFRKKEAELRSGAPVLVSVACNTCRSREQRPLTAGETVAAHYSHRAEMTDWYPTAPLENWREMWRGQHGKMGIATAADFFTQRNLRALAAVWSAASRSPERLALRFATTAIVNRASRRYQWNPKRPTNVLSGTLYIASLTYEFNVFSLLRRKLSAVVQLAKTVEQATGHCEVTRSSATNLSHIEDQSVDYVFTDPPFGANIYYSDASFLWESWLDQFTDTTNEAVVSTSLATEHGGKTLDDYEKLMSASFGEIARVLKPGAWASVMFHSSDDAVWSSLERAIESADLKLESAVAFDKSQPSFKGVKQMTNKEKVSSFDLVLHLHSSAGHGTRRRTAAVETIDKAEVVEAIAEHLDGATARRRSTPYLHSFVMRLLLERGASFNGYSYGQVETLLAEHFPYRNSSWLPRSQEPVPATTFKGTP